MKISIFSSLDGNPSIDRYARELAQNFPPTVEVVQAGFPRADGLRSRVFDKYLKYPWVAHRQQGDYNIIVSEGYGFLLLALEGKCTLAVCHDVHPLIYRGRGPWTFWRARYRFNLRMLRQAKYVVTVSDHTRKDLLERCPFLSPEKVVAIHSGIGSNWSVVSDAPRLASFCRQCGLDGKRFALHVGNDNWYKNFAGLLRALAELSGKDLFLVKVGEIGDDNRRLIANLGLETRVIHVPYASNDELLCFYNAAEMLVFPSWHEGFGWPPLEAMACGCPVIASRRASLPEVCGDACLYVEPGDTSGIAAAMEKVLMDPSLRAELIQKGSARARRFSWKETAAAILNLLQTPAA